MIRFLALRLVRLVVTMLVCSFIVYGALYLAPGGALAAITGGRVLSAADQAQIISQYHLNDPFIDRYLTWLGHAVTGDFGQSLVSREQVSALIAPRIATTALLVVYSSVMIVIIGVGLGLFAATRGGRADQLVVASMSAFAAVPSFVAAALLLALFSVQIRAFPSFGSGTGFAGQLYHLTLPAAALAIAAIGYIGRVTRSAVLEEQGRDHVQTAVSRGLAHREVVRSHVLRNALVPITTTAGITIASLIAGSVVIEQVFALNGLGSLLLTSINEKDFAVVQGVSLILVAGFVIINTLVDMIYPVLDPRIRRGGAS
jgi:peptide/nickel transport system permease protein